MNIAIIPARGGSRRIPRKNIRLFHGKPIIAYSIEAARASGLFDRIIVSTEDANIAAVAQAYGAKVHNRARRLADDITGTQVVMKAALEQWIGSSQGKVPDFACCIYATAPLMTAADLSVGYGALLSGRSSYVYSSGRDPLSDAGQWYWGKTQAFLDSVPLDDDHALRLILPPSRVCDINTEDDWQRAERMYAELQEMCMAVQVQQA